MPKPKKKKDWKDHDDFVKKQNEWCFLPKKQKIKYHSFTLLEFFPLEKINALLTGLDKLYGGARPAHQSRLTYKEVLLNAHNKLFQWNSMNLPYITTDKLKGKIIPDGVFLNLGENIRHYHINIYKVLPSLAILQIQVYLDESISDKINNIIYSYHKEKKEKIETPKGNYTNIYDPPMLKKDEIDKLRTSLRNEAIDFLSTYFKGYFFELRDKNDNSVVPFIDLFSLDYPTDEKKINEWGRKNHSFLSCFGTYISPHTTYKYNNYLLCLESNRNTKFNNYVIFANRKNTGTNMYPDKDSSIEETLNFNSFELFAIDRWIKIYESVVGAFNTQLSKEIVNLSNNKINLSIKTRKRILKNIFYFERFKVEFDRFSHISEKFDFQSLKDTRKSPMVKKSEKTSMFVSHKKGINKRIKDIEKIISIFTKQSENILSLKSIEFNKNMQIIVSILSALVLIFMIIQIIIAIKINPEFILYLIFK